MRRRSTLPATMEELIERIGADAQAVGRRRTLHSNRHLWKSETVARFYDEVVRLVRVDLARADRVARAAVWIAKQLDDESASALGLRAVGHVYFLKGKQEPAWEHYQAALEIYERLGRDLEVGRTLSGSLQTLIYLGRYDEAYRSAQQARAIFARHGDRLRLARLDTNMGNILYRQDRFEEALELYRRSYADLLEIGEPQDVAAALKNIAVCQISLNRFREALATYHSARAWCAERQMPLLVAETDYNIAYLYYLRGEYTRAIALYRATREYCETVGDRYHQGLCDLDQSEMYLELNLSEEGAHLARRALDTFRQLGMGYEAAKALTNLAIAASRHGDWRFALEVFRKARDLFGVENNRAWIATIDLYQALVCYQSGSMAEARFLCESAYRFFEPSPLMGKAILCQLLRARILLNSGQVEEAVRTCCEALQKVDQAESPALSFQVWFVMGVIEEERGCPDAAYEAYRKAHERLENLRSRLKAEEIKIAFLKDKLAVYEALVRMALSRGSSEHARETAFEYIEQAKSRSLADLIAFRAHHLRAPREINRTLVEQVSTLREKLN
jgi:tetratricopeptide (TPR) repeat protein